MRRVLLGAILLLGCLAIQQRPTPAIGRDALEPSLAATINIRNFQFTPGVLQVKAGTTVTWVNGEGTHTVTADNGAFASDNLSTGQTFTFKFTRPGTFRYYCSFHGSRGGGNMSGLVKVTR